MPSTRNYTELQRKVLARPGEGKRIACRREALLALPGPPNVRDAERMLG